VNGIYHSRRPEGRKITGSYTNLIVEMMVNGYSNILGTKCIADTDTRSFNYLAYTSKSMIQSNNNLFYCKLTLFSDDLQFYLDTNAYS